MNDVIHYIRFAIIIVGTIAIVLGFSKPSTRSLDKLINFASGILAIHAGHSLIIDIFLPDKRYLDYASPYGLVYGPLLYFALRFGATAKIPKKVIVHHTLPFAVSLIFFLLIILSSAVKEYLDIYLKILYSLLPLSFLIYSLWAFFYKGTGDEYPFRAGQKLVNIFIIILLVTGAFFVTVEFTKEDNTHFIFIRPIIYLIMLGAVINLLLYNISRLSGSTENPLAQDVRRKATAEIVPAYQKSGVSEEQLKDYEEKLRNLLIEKKIYLDPELNLTKTAAMLKIPKHHLSQLINLRMKKNFNQLINSFRVNHACGLIQNNKESLNLSEISFRSGFNSRISFTRNFNKEMNCSPREFSQRFSRD